MGAALNDEQLRAVEQQLTERPEILQALRENQNRIGGRARYMVRPGTPGYMQDASRILAQYGINFPDIEDYQIQVDPQGNVHLDRQNWFQRNMDWIAPVSTIGGGAAASWLSGGANAAPEVSIRSASNAGASAPGLTGALSQPWTAPAASSAFSGANLLRYGAPVVGGAINNVLQNRQAAANREAQQRESNQRTAVQESMLDPFRGVMSQASDINRLEHLANGPQIYRPSMNSRYARYYNPANEPPPLSDTARSSYVNARDMVARGEGTVPTMLDPNNWGDTGTYDLTQPGGASPASRIARRRRLTPPTTTLR